MNEPPRFMIDRAREAALKSPCLKSRRGVVLYRPLSGTAWSFVSDGFNSPPGAFSCTGTDLCRRDCAKLCLHAEDRALRAAGTWTYGLTMLHVKVIDGKVVPGGPPSCWQCSRLVVEADIHGVWLYELPPGNLTGHDLLHVVGNWRFYTPEEFHLATLRECGLGDQEDR